MPSCTSPTSRCPNTATTSAAASRPLMRSPDVFVVLFEYGPESLGTPLFAAQGVPRVDCRHVRLEAPAAAAAGPARLPAVLHRERPARSASTSSPGAARTCRASSPRSTRCSPTWMSDRDASTRRRRRAPTLGDRARRRASRSASAATCTRRSFLVRTAIFGSALAGQPAAVSAAPGLRVRVALRTRRVVRVGLDRVLLHRQRRSEHLPARLDARGLVEGRQLVVLPLRPALLHRLQRVVRFVRMRRERLVRPGVRRVQLPLRVGHVRRAVHVLQPVPLRPVPPGARVRRRRSCAGSSRVSPPWEFDATCTTTSATANATALHDAPCLHELPLVGARVRRRRRSRAADRTRCRRRSSASSRRRPGGGYWLASADGGVFSFGDARFHGFDRAAITSTARSSTSRARRAGKGYWLVALRRRRLLFRRRALPRLDGRRAPERADRRHGGDADRARATGWSRPTAACSASATRGSTARWAAST